MAACGSLQHIFGKPLAENATLLESLTWNQINPVKPIDQSSFTEIFGELHFKESSESSSSASSSIVNNISSLPSSSSKLDLIPQTQNSNLSQNDACGSSSEINQTPFSGSLSTSHTKSHKSSDSFSSLSSESLQLCTEGLGFESSDDVEEMKNEMNACWQMQGEEVSVKKHLSSQFSFGECRRSRVSGGEYPPPISCIGRTGKPWVCFRSYRKDGRFVLKQIRIPTQEFLHAYREDGRLKLNFVQPDDEFPEEDEEEEDDELDCIDEEEENVENEHNDCVTEESK
ncbi:hypothetical protein L6164_022128 [Bauhinia variegata]|uniref:Uncharacterized protein n=1 Tax=Bauhinia variegata TaxID=167791 RepID=A0ACB9ME62_BAUVA|nr:hypothetical protein L6164_022128 [Bauhinia variegata]